MVVFTQCVCKSLFVAFSLFSHCELPLRFSLCLHFVVRLSRSLSRISSRFLSTVSTIVVGSACSTQHYLSGFGSCLLSGLLWLRCVFVDSFTLSLTVVEHRVLAVSRCPSVCTRVQAVVCVCVCVGPYCHRHSFGLHRRSSHS